MDYIALGLIVAIVGYAIVIYNRLVKARQMVREAWSGIDVQLKRRANLIPNLVKTVQGYADHEKVTLKEVIEMRNKAQAIASGDVEGRAIAEGMLGAALGKLFALSEDYPDLKANQNFQDLQKSLDKMEREIQMARRFYNGAARDLNVQVESFPSNLVASTFKFTQADFYEIKSKADREVPKVEFGG